MYSYWDWRKFRDNTILKPFSCIASLLFLDYFIYKKEVKEHRKETMVYNLIGDEVSEAETK